jgi:hypothetical protein
VRVDDVGADPLAHGPTVRHTTRANAATVALSDRVNNYTTRSSKSAVNRVPARDRFGDHTVLGAGQPAPPHPQPTGASAQVKVPPGRVDIRVAIPPRRGERARRADQHPAPQRNINNHFTGATRLTQIYTDHQDARQIKDAVQ